MLKIIHMSYTKYPERESRQHSGPSKFVRVPLCVPKCDPNITVSQGPSTGLERGLERLLPDPDLPSAIKLTFINVEYDTYVTVSLLSKVSNT